MAAKVTINQMTMEVPVYVKLGGREIEIGKVEVGIDAHVQTVSMDDSDDEGAAGEDTHAD